ncbi:MAG TPA: hypothetical protein VFH75_00855, partial [Actinomycetota bacterium]|nr:hypothetical protein [Actinomycetota bacterium]
MTWRRGRDHRRVRRLEERLSEAGHRIREHLDTEKVIKTTAVAVGRALPPGVVRIWLTAGSDVPRLAYCTRSSSEDGAPSPAVRKCAERRRPVRDAETPGLAVPIMSRRAGLFGVLSIEGRAFDSDEERLVAGVAREAGLAMEAANLYERAVAEKEKSEAILSRVADAVVVTSP